MRSIPSPKEAAVPTEHDRRTFLATVGGLAALATSAEAQAPAQRPAAAPIDIGWIDALKGKHKQVFDLGSFDLSVDYPLQQLRRAVEPVRASNGVWQRRAADSLSAFYLSNTSSIYKVLLEQTDSLFLSKAQVAALQAADSVFSARVRQVYIPLGEFLARGHGEAGKAELDSAKATEKAYWKIFWEQPEIAGAIITPAQRELMPMLKSMMAVPVKERENSQWEFGHPVTVADKPKVPTP
jgi:hypothetical protein